MASGIINSKVLQVNTGAGAYWSFEWVSRSESRGVTAIDWSIYGRGRYSSPTWLDNGVTVTVTMEPHKTTDLYKKDYGGSSSGDTTHTSVSFKDRLKASGTFYVNHDTSGNGAFTIAFTYAQIQGTSKSYNVDHTQTVNLPEKNYPYTPCVAPTSVSADLSKIKPDQAFTIKWSGAKGGVANEIKEYQIYYRITREGSNPTTSTYSYTEKISDPTATSHETTLPTYLALRGYKIRYGMVACGSAGSAYNSEMKIGPEIRINQLSYRPTIKEVNPKIITSYAESTSIKITVNPGVDPDGDVCTVWYAKGTPEGEKKQITGSILTDTLTSGTTYYFWTKDSSGEYSDSYVSQTITKNSKPKLTITSTGKKLKACSLKVDDNYVISPVVEVTSISGGQSDNNKYTYKLYIEGKTDPIILLENSPSHSCSIEDIRLKIAPKSNSATYYWIGVTRNDGVEDSEEAIDSKAKYCIPQLPKLINLTNCLNGKESKTGWSGYFLNEFSAIIDYDEGYDSIQVLGEDNNGIKETSAVALTTLTPNVSKYGSFNSTALKSFERGYSYTLKVSLKYKKGFTTSIESTPLIESTPKTWYRIKKGSVTGFNYSDVIKPYEAGNKSFSVTNLFNVDKDCKHFGVATETAGFILSIGSSTFNQWQKLTELGNTINLTLTAQELYNGLCNDSGLDVNGIQSPSIKMTFTNVFGESWTSEGSVPVQLDFTMPPEIEERSEWFYVKWLSAPSGTSEKDKKKGLKEWAYLKEGVQVFYKATCYSYNSNPQIQLQVSETGQKLWRNYNTKISFGDSTGTKNSGEFGPGNPYKYEIDQVVATIKEVTSDQTIDLRRIISNSSLQEAIGGQINSIPVKRHVKPTVKLIEANYDPPASGTGEGTINFTYNLDDDGLGKGTLGSKVIKIQKRTSEGEYTDLSVLDQASTSVKATIDAISFVRIVVTTTMGTTLRKNNDASTDLETPEYETTCSQESNELAVYGLTPTVGYRQNRIGINISDWDSLDGQGEGAKPVIAIRSFGTKNKIKLMGLNAAGEVSSEINIDTGEITNFVIDGGSW